MYGLAYCKLDYYFLHEMNLEVLSVLIKSEIDKEVHEYDIAMRKLSWQTSHLMNSTGNYKTPIKPEKLYESTVNQKSKKKPVSTHDIESKRNEIRNLFGIDK